MADLYSYEAEKLNDMRLLEARQIYEKPQIRQPRRRITVEIPVPTVHVPRPSFRIRPQAETA